MSSPVRFIQILANLRRPFWGVLLCLAAGCSHRSALSSRLLAERILPPPDIFSTSAPAPSASAETLPPPKKIETEEGQKAGEREKVPGQTSPDPNTPAPAAPRDPAPCQTLTLPDAIDLAFQLQPRLRASLESIQQARSREDISFSAFLPTATTAYHAGGLQINAGGTGFSVTGAPGGPNFVVLPLLGAVPVGLSGQTSYELAELKLQWLVCDFGRRMGLYNQSLIATDIAQLQTQRAYQTVANDVAVSYFHVLRTRSLRRIARESLRRGEDDLDVAQKLACGGVIEREKVLRAQVALAQAQRALDVAEEEEAIAVAALNLAIGLNVSAVTGVVDTTETPPVTEELADCLRAAVNSRREFQVARQSVQGAQEGSRVARADFAPRIVTRGTLLDYQQATPRGHFDIALGYIGLEWGLFDGGKRVGELRVANARIRETLAQADAIADTIAFQVNQAYRQMVAARKGIERTRPSVEQTRETYRLVQARYREGDAIPSELTDAEAALTRSEQDYLNSIYDYLIARSRLDYAMGTTPTPATARKHH
jgi:outer membrane protein